MGIRVNGVAPGIIRTPLWTSHPEKLKFLDESQDEWVEPTFVADSLLRCVTDDDIGGGYIMEVLKDKTRNVDFMMAPPPEGPGATTANRGDAEKEVLEWLEEYSH